MRTRRGKSALKRAQEFFRFGCAYRVHAHAFGDLGEVQHRPVQVELRFGLRACVFGADTRKLNIEHRIRSVVEDDCRDVELFPVLVAALSTCPRACHEAGITVTLPKPQTSGAKSDGRFGKQCTTGPERRIGRWQHEHLLEAVQQRLDANPQAMRQDALGWASGGHPRETGHGKTADGHFRLWKSLYSNQNSLLFAKQFPDRLTRELLQKWLLCRRYFRSNRGPEPQILKIPC